MKCKRLDAFIRRERLSFVLMALDDLPDFPGVTVLECQGFGKKGSQRSHKRIVEFLVEPNRHVKLEIICPGIAVDKIITTIRGQLTGPEAGGGKFYLCDVEERIGAVGIGGAAGDKLIDVGPNWFSGGGNSIDIHTI